MGPPQASVLRPGEAGEVVAEGGGGGATTSRSSSAQPAGGPPSRSGRRPAEGDATVRGRAEVVDQGPAVGDALAAGPADLLQQVRHRLGEDDVGGGDGERLRSGAARRLRRGADGEDRGVGPNRPPAARSRASTAGAPATQAPHRRELVDLDARGSQPLAQAERQPSRLHGGRVGVEGAAAEGRRGAARGDLIGRQRPDRSPAPSSRQAATRLGPGRVVGRRGRDLQVAGVAEPGIDLLARGRTPRSRPPPLATPARPRAPPRPPSAPACWAARTTSRCRSPRCARSARAHRSASSSTTLASGSSCLRCQAAHIPVYPPPITTTSALRSPTSAGSGRDTARLLQPVPVRGVLHRASRVLRQERTGVLATRLIIAVATFDAARRPAAGDRGVRAGGAGAPDARLRTADDRDPPPGRRRGGARRGRHLRRARPRRAAGRRAILDLTGHATLGEFCEFIGELDTFPAEPQRDVSRLYRRWAFESAALDLALRQAGTGLAAPSAARRARSRSSARCGSSPATSEPSSIEPLRRKLDPYPDLRFKLDPTNDWDRRADRRAGRDRRGRLARPEGLLQGHPGRRRDRPRALPS